MIYHIATPRTIAGSRIHAQIAALGEGCRLAVRPRLPWNKRVLSVLKPENVLVFHQPWTIPLLLVCYVVSAILNRECRFVYDMHDWQEVGFRRSWSSRAGCMFDITCEWLASRVNVKFLTVSKGLAALARYRYNVEALVFYNIPFGIDPLPPPAFKKRSLVYFGQINTQRLPNEIISWLVTRGITLDIYGVCHRGSEKTWFNELKNELAQTGGVYMGPYRPTDITFVSNYSKLLLYYPGNDKNLRFCMPNKLFQSLFYGVGVLVSSNLEEIISEFGDCGAVTVISADVNWPDLLSRIDADAVRSKLLQVRETSRSNLQKVLDL